MPKFSEHSHKLLLKSHKDIKLIMYMAIKTFDFTINETFRNKDRQNKAYQNGHSKLKWPNSKHNTEPSEAIDIIPYKTGYKDIKAFYVMAGIIENAAYILKTLGLIEHNIRWGGDWDGDHNTKDQSFNDLAHFELK